MAALSDLENGAIALEKIGLQAILTGSALSPSEIVAAVDSVSVADVKAVCFQIS